MDTPAGREGSKDGPAVGRKVLKFDGLSGRGLWYRPLGAQRTHFALANWICRGASATRKSSESVTAVDALANWICKGASAT